jgi:hypothetical protein
MATKKRSMTMRIGVGFPTVEIGGGEAKQVAHEGPRYSAMYEMEGPPMLLSAARAEAVALGR